MTLTESSIRPGTVNLISTDHLRVAAISAAISLGLAFQVLSFLVWVEAQAIQICESFDSDRNRDLGAKLYVASGLAANNQPDVRLAEADDAVWDASAVRVLLNVLLPGNSSLTTKSF